ncbi:MAG: ABC transporter ATP-binding protein [Alphaproteobacteria bacterium]|nr:ABC transporter ATP-binding protein [Alphaproteobacteria bacterium]
MSDLLTIRDLHIRFAAPGGFIHAVRGASFRVRPRSTVALVGESGSGKSVVSQAIMRILPRNGEITQGNILFNDPRGAGTTVDLARLPANSLEMRAIRGGRISIIFQEPMTSLSPLHTVGNQVGEALRLHRRVGSAEAVELTQEILRLVGFPDPHRALRSYPFELSGGLRQRAMIAMALVCRPALLIADEPTTALDVTIQAQILKLILELQHELGMAVLLITHDLGVVANVAEEIVVMYRGEVVESGTLHDIFRQPEHPYLRALLRAVPRFDMKPGERLMPIREIASGDAPHLMAKKAQWPAGYSGPLLECRGLHKSFTIRKAGIFGSGRAAARVIAVDDVSLKIERGECLGLVGESGCGKTTLSKILLRAVEPDVGSITFNDHGKQIDVLALEGDRLKQFRRQVQFIFQDPFGSLNPRMTVFDIVEEPLAIHGIGDARSRRGIVEELVELVGLNRHHLRRYPHSFSGGQRQRIGIARALALRPDLVVCDEPTSALDVSIQAQILNLLMDLKQKLGLTYLFISHNLAVVDYIADRIAVMCAGRIVETADRATLFRAPVHPYTQALLAAVPTPDLAQRLDFRRLMEDRASDPGAWPEPFRRERAKPLGLFEVAPGHVVEARAMPTLPVRAGGLARA